MNISIHMMRYLLPNPPSQLKHKRRNPIEILVSWLMDSHVCQICGRKEIWSVSGWVQINDPRHQDKHECSVVCQECWKTNEEYFEFLKEPR